MLKIITKEFVKEKISSAETTLDECFEMLLDFKHGRGDLGDILANFQPKLAECLYQLMQFYHELQKEKKHLISQKEKYSKQEFSTMMANNASFSKVVSQTIEIGKNLGDAYVWFFFRDNRSELDKHFQHNTTGLYVGGIGGLGELEFIKNAPIRLTKLIKPLLDLVDEGKIALTPAEKLSYLKEEEQRALAELIQDYEATPSLSQAVKLKEMSAMQLLDADMMFEVMSRPKPNQKETLKLDLESLRTFFPDCTPKDMESAILRILTEWQKREQSKVQSRNSWDRGGR